jgi:Rv0078B-related antitoxin
MGQNLVAERVRQALELSALTEAMMRQRLRREHPDEGEAELETRMLRWRQTRPGAEHGDAAGVVGTWPRGK